MTWLLWLLASAGCVLGASAWLAVFYSLRVATGPDKPKPVFDRDSEAIGQLARVVEGQNVVLAELADHLEVVASDGWATYNPATRRALAEAAMKLRICWPSPRPEPWPWPEPRVLNEEKAGGPACPVGPVSREPRR